MSAREGIVNGSVGLVSRALSQLLILAVTLVATRFLTVEQFGAYAIAAALLFLARNLLYVGAYEYLLKTPAGPSLALTCLAVNMLIASAAIGGLALLAFVSEPLFGTADVRLLILALLPSVLLVALTSWYEAQLLKRMRLRSYYGVTILGELVGAAVGIGCLMSGMGLVSLVFQTYARLATMGLIYASLGHGAELGRPERGAVPRVVRWSGHRYAAAFLNFGTNYGADLLLGLLMSPAATGLFRAAHRIVHALADLFVQPLLKIAQMHVSARIARGEGPGRGWLDMFPGVAAVGWAALAGLGATAEQLVPFVLGSQWTAAAPVVTILCAVRALTLLDSVTTPVLIASDRQPYMLRVQVLATAGTLGLAALAATRGPALVAAASGVVALAVTLAYARESVRLSALKAGQLARTLALAATPAILVIIAILGAQRLAGEGATLALLISAGLVAGVLGLIVLRRPYLLSLAAIGHGGARAEAA